MQYIETTDGMEMPCKCDKCGGWFDLNDGTADPKSNKVLCQSCGDLAQEIFDIEEEIESRKDEIDGYESSIRDEREIISYLEGRLRELQGREY